jgi:mannose-6-phosphate isomerase-like protein (cupin superfamily)
MQKRPVLAAIALLVAVPAAVPAQQPERKVEPTFLRRAIAQVVPKAVDISTDACLYKPLFGAGDAEASIARGVARYGEVTLAPGGGCKPANYPAEEQVYVILEGSGTLHYGTQTSPLKKHDFMYLPAGVEHWVANTSTAPVKFFVMGFRVPAGTPPPEKLMIANYDDVAKQQVGGHPDSVVYQLMMGDTTSKRDRLASAHVLTSLYVMEFQPGGTNFPHHHDTEEEIYVLLDGRGDMVAGSGTNGVEGRFPSAPGDAWFFRMNCTVGFYNGTGMSHILAVRSVYPRRRQAP